MSKLRSMKRSIERTSKKATPISTETILPKMPIKTLNRDYIEDEIGYRPFTTFFEDFSIADAFGIDAIKDTFDSAMRSWSSDIKYLTELTMVMSWKCGIYFEEGNYEYNRTYHDLYYTVRDYVYDHFEDDDLNYFYHTTA